jgi:hypothetical protein
MDGGELRNVFRPVDVKAGIASMPPRGAISVRRTPQRGYLSAASAVHSGAPPKLPPSDRRAIEGTTGDTQ